jgi:hypothetical protein
MLRALWEFFVQTLTGVGVGKLPLLGCALASTWIVRVRRSSESRGRSPITLMGVAKPGDEGPVASKTGLEIRSGRHFDRGGSAGVVGRDRDNVTAGC